MTPLNSYLLNKGRQCPKERPVTSKGSRFDLKLIKGILSSANLVQGHSNIAAQHRGALVDQQAAPEVVLCHLILLLPEVDLPHPVPVNQASLGVLP